MGERPTFQEAFPQLIPEKDAFDSRDVLNGLARECAERRKASIAFLQDSTELQSDSRAQL